jgi:hypothetical protein
MCIFLFATLAGFAAAYAWIKYSHSTDFDRQRETIRRSAASLTAAAGLLLAVGLVWVALEKTWGHSQEIIWRDVSSSSPPDE